MNCLPWKIRLSGSSTGAHDLHTRMMAKNSWVCLNSEGSGKIKMKKSCSHCFGRWDHKLLVYMWSAC